MQQECYDFEMSTTFKKYLLKVLQYYPDIQQKDVEVINLDFGQKLFFQIEMRKTLILRSFSFFFMFSTLVVRPFFTTVLTPSSTGLSEVDRNDRLLRIRGVLSVFT